MVSIGVRRGRPAGVWRGTPLGLRGWRDRRALKGTAQPWFTKTDDEPTSFTPMRREADLTHRITSSAWKRIVWGHGDAEGLGGLEVDHQLELHRLLHGQVRGL